MKRLIQSNILQIERIFTDAFKLSNDEVEILKNYIKR